MTISPFRRGLALFLSCQPVFWMSEVAYAQTIQEGLTPAPEASPFGAFSTAPDVLGEPRAPVGTTGGERSTERATLTSPASGAPVDEPIDADRYVCGPGDVFELNFWGAQNLKQRVAVDLEGRAFVPRVGYFELGGRTLADARRTVRESLARLFPRVSFELSLAAPRTFLVQVVDDVVHPGSYSARAIDRVATVVNRAGGFGPNASRRRVEIRRRSGTVIRADLLLFALTGDVKYNPNVLDGDIVRVPFEDLAATIGGAVNRPGRYELVGSRDLAELVDLAGGFAPTATHLLPISIVRREGDDTRRQELLQHLDGKLPTASLQHEDEVRIPSYTEINQSVMVIGAVAGAAPVPAPSPASGDRPSGGSMAPDEASATRRLPFVEGDSVRTLLERVGGVTALADLSNSYILRAGQVVPVDLYALVMLRDLRADKPVQLGDTLIVPFKRRNILVEGAVFNPGQYAYNPSFGVVHYLGLAGGPNRFAQDLKNVRIVTPTGQIVPYSRDLKVEPGSSLVVPERNFSRAEIVQIVLGVASVLVSASALLVATRQARP